MDYIIKAGYREIYLVFGECGKHDDYRMWVTIAFDDKQDAIEYKNKCQADADRIEKDLFKLAEKMQVFNQDVWLENCEKNPDYSTEYFDKMKKIQKSHKYDPDFNYDDPVKYDIKILKVFKKKS